MKRMFLGLGMALVCAFTMGSAQNNLSFSGTVYALSGSGLQNAVVIACLLENDACSDQRSGAQQIAGNGSSARFQITNLEDADYLLLAWRDLNGNGEADAGDEIGVYQQGGKPALLRPPASNLELRLSKFSGDLDSLINQAESPSSAPPPASPPASPPTSGNTNVTNSPLRFGISSAWRNSGNGSYEATFGKDDPNQPKGTINLEVLPVRAKSGALLAQTRAIWQAETKGQLDKPGQSGGVYARRLPGGLNVGITFGTLRRGDNPNKQDAFNTIIGMYSVLFVIEHDNQVTPIFFVMTRPDVPYAYATEETEGRGLMLEMMNNLKPKANITVSPLYTEADLIGKWKETSNTFVSSDWYNPSTGAYVTSSFNASAFTLRLGFQKGGVGTYDATFVQASNTGSRTQSEKTASRWRIAGDQVIVERPSTGRRAVYQLYGIGKDDRGQPVILTRYLGSDLIRDDLDNGPDKLWVVDR